MSVWHQGQPTGIGTPRAHQQALAVGCNALRSGPLDPIRTGQVYKQSDFPISCTQDCAAHQRPDGLLITQTNHSRGYVAAGPHRYLKDKPNGYYEPKKQQHNDVRATEQLTEKPHSIHMRCQTPQRRHSLPLSHRIYHLRQV